MMAIPDGWLVIGAQYHRVFDDYIEAKTVAALWGKVLPLYHGEAIPPHEFQPNGPGVIGADNCQICGVWFDIHPRRDEAAVLSISLAWEED